MKFLAWCWKTSRIKSTQTPKSQPDLRKVINYNLADLAFDKPNTIDLLLGQSVYTHCEVTECQRMNYTANRHDPWLDSLKCR